ncbi:MAG: SIMPL domain-containing protein [Mucilaginibacter polytrichastri]|nr:SIMPL domain-containing protein [Mucilaginibacter polytrichastri]
MKKIITLAITLLFSSALFAQQADLRRKIEVTGTAEQEITPDIIYVGISLKEYLNGKNKVEITTLEKALLKAVTDAGIPKADFTVNNVSSYNYTNPEKRKNPEFLARKQYRIKVRDLNKYNLLLSKLDAKGIEQTNVEGYDYSNLEQLKNELKLKALKAAKEKAEFLAKGIGESIGSALEINDQGDSGLAQPMVMRNYAMAKADMSEADSAPEIDFKKTKITCTMRAVFELK